MKLKGKVAFVTGGARGIGKAIATALAKEGADVVISDINLDQAKETAEEVKNLGVKSIAIKTDVTNAQEVEEGVAMAVKDLGKIDILVNNAGINRDALLVRMKEEDWDLVLDTNLKGMYNCTKVMAPLMMRQRWGRIINIASVVGQMGNPGQANYAAAKAGVMGFTKTVARELASRGITCNALAPGFIDTEMTRKLPEEIKEKLKAQIPLNRFGDPEDVAKAVLFLAAEGNYITGTVINIDGGMVMH